MDYNYGYGMGDAFAAVLGALLVALALSAVVGLALYVLQSIGIMTIASRRGMQNPWIIWIPVAGIYTIGAIADDIQAREGNRTFYRWLLLAGQLVTSLTSIVSCYQAFRSFFNMIDSYGSYGSDPYSFLTPLYMFGGLFGGIASLISIGVLVLTIISLYYIYKCYKPENATAFTILSVIFPFLQCVFPFVIRNRQPNWLNPPPYYAPPGGSPPEGGFPGGNPDAYQYAPPPPDFGQQPPYGGFPGQGGPVPPQQPPYQQPPQQQPPSRNPYGEDPR